MKNKLIIIKKLVTLTTILLLFPAHSVYAASSIYVAVSAKTVYAGSTVLVGIRMNSSSDVNAVQANIQYPAEKLTYVSTSFVGSAFEIQAESSAGGGTVRIARGTTTTLSGDNSIALLVFRANVDSGSATISISSDSNLVNNGATVSSGGIGATVNFGSAPPAAPAAPTPVADTTPPTISEVSSSATLQTSATINWKTNEDSDSIVDYGPTSAYGLSISSTERTSSHKIVLSSTFIMPKTAYHYRVTSADAAGNKTVSDDKTFTTTSYIVIVNVVDKKNKPIADATVSSDGVTAKTDSQGKATLEVTLGKKTVTASKDNHSTSGSITVTNDIAKNNPIKLTLERTNKYAFLPYVLGGFTIFGLGALLGALVIVHLRPKIVKVVKLRKAKKPKHSPHIIQKTTIESPDLVSKLSDKEKINLEL